MITNWLEYSSFKGSLISKCKLLFGLCIINYELWIKEVVPGRLELPTSTLSVWRSDQLSYRTVVCSWCTMHNYHFHAHAHESRLAAVQDLGLDSPASFFSISKNRCGSTRRMEEYLTYPFCFPSSLSLLFFFAVNSSTCILSTRQPAGNPSPERRCSSRTFRYGYLVTT